MASLQNTDCLSDLRDSSTVGTSNSAQEETPLSRLNERPFHIQVAEEWARAHDYVVVDHFVAENSTIDLTMLDTQITDRDVYFKDPTSTDSPQPLKNM